MIKFLQEYLRIDTSHPTPDYTRAIALLKKQALTDGFNVQVLTLASDRPVLIITALGTCAELPALALNHHIDVVPIEDKTAWKTNPFGGEILDGILIGRGVQDMKGVGVAQYYALKELAQEKKLQRTVHVLCVPDEEIGGFTGTKKLLDHRDFKKLNIGYVLDEGLPSGNQNKLFVKIAERKPIQIFMTAHGTPGHGSDLMHPNPIHKLVDILKELVSLHTQNQINPHEPGSKLSLNITSLKAGTYKDGIVALNVIPGSATATIDIRVPAHTKLAEVKVLLDTYIQKHTSVTYTIAATIDDYTLDPNMIRHTDIYQALVQSIQAHGLHAQDLYFQATTDVRYYQARGIIGLGFTPFTTHANLHGVNESVPTDDLIQGKNIIKTFLNLFCTNLEDA